MSELPPKPSSAPSQGADTPKRRVKSRESAVNPTKAQRAWLARGLDQAGGKLPLFDHNGRRVSQRLVQICVEKGWAEPWFANPLKPDWQVCKLTDAGRKVLEEA